MARTGPLEACVGGTHPCSRGLNKNSKCSTSDHPGDRRISSRSQEPPSQCLPVSVLARRGPVPCCGCPASCVWEQTPGRAAKVGRGQEINTHTLLTAFQVCPLKHLASQHSFSRIFRPTSPRSLQARRSSRRLWSWGSWPPHMHSTCCESEQGLGEWGRGPWGSRSGCGWSCARPALPPHLSPQTLPASLGRLSGTMTCGRD